MTLKNIFRVTLAVVSLASMFCFEANAENPKNKKRNMYMSSDTLPVDPPKIFIGVGTGINNFSGIIGPSAEFSIKNTASIFLGGGLGSWGFKYSVGGRYYFSYPRKSAVSISYSGAGGASKATVKLNTLDMNGATVLKNVDIKLKPVSVLNFSYLYFFRLGKKHRFNLEAGYGVNLSGKNNFQVLSNDVITKSSYDVINFIQPGGIILAAGFTFGIN